jgi:tetratricopeptide (TPR) repeat protein
MSPSTRAWLIGFVLLPLAASELRAQIVIGDRPTPAVPLRPRTREELDHREAQELYALGLLQERDSRLLEAVTTFEKARSLDPDSAVLHKALVPLYLALDRNDDALNACRRALDLAPGDYETWFLYARQLKVRGRTPEAIAALEKAIACPALKEHPELHVQMVFDLGVLHETSQEFDRAAARFTEVVAILDKPDVLLEQGGMNLDDLTAQAAETCEHLGRVCVRAGQFDKAIAAYRKAQTKDPRREQRLYYNLADLYLGQNKLDLALKNLDEYLKTQPQSVEGYELKITLLKRLNRERDILPALSRAAATDEENLDLKLLLARQFAAAGKASDAEGVYQRLLQKAARPDIYRGLFNLFKGQGQAGAARILNSLDEALTQGVVDPDKPANPSEAEASASRARAMLIVLRDDPEMVKMLLPVVRQRLQTGTALHADTRRYLAVLAGRAHQLDDAEQLYRACLEQPGVAGRRNESELYFGLLHVLQQGRKYEAIVQVCRQGLAQAQNTNRVLFHLDLSEALMHLGKVDEAITEANNAVDIAGDQERLVSRRHRALVLSEAGRHEQAVAECQAMLKEFTQAEDLRHVRYTLSNIYSQAKNYTGAEEQLQRIIKDHPVEPTAHNDLGYLWADQGKNLEEAETLIRKALDLDRAQKSKGQHVETDSDQDNAAYIDSLGWVLFRRGRLDEARQELERATSLPGGTDDPVLWDHLGDVWARLQDTARARSAWQKAVEMYETGRLRRPDERYKDIQQKLKLLEVRGGRR